MLSPAQQAAATAPGHVLIAACPGSGKTTVLKDRAKFLLESDLSARLAAVTFTKDASTSLKERIVKVYPPAAKRLDAGTFHSLCIRQLNRSGIQVKPLADGAAARLIQDAIKSCPHGDTGLKYDDYLQAIEEWQRDIDAVIPPSEQSALAYVYRTYTASKRRLGLMDFGDMLREAVLGMRNGTVEPLDVAYMLVDEFQDTDNIQLLWVLEHAKRGTQVTIVGDDDQSIYGFRGSLGYNGMLEFQSRTGATLINLDRTYRCAREILQPAAVLIANNTARVPKQLMTGSSEKGVVNVLAFESREAEADAVVNAIIDSGNASEWGILARTNAQLELIEARVLNRFEYSIKSGSSFWDLKAPSHLLSLAESVAGRNMLGVSELLTMSGVSRGTLDTLARQFEFEKPGALDRFCDTRMPKGANRSFVESMQDTVAQWRDQFRSGSQSQLKLALSGMANHIHKYGNWKSGDSDDVQKRLSLAASSILSLKGTVDQRLRTLTQKNESSGGGASLMTLHASKGLEFDKVWLVGCDLGTIPSIRDGSDVQEERRLMYVAITRARADLTLSYSLENGPSQFLSECELIGGGVLAKQTFDAVAYG